MYATHNASEAHGRNGQPAGLNKAQQEAVEVTGNVCVMAVPGSGKTRVLEHRAERLLREPGDGGVIAVTFTNKGAEELRQRLLKRVGPRHGKRLMVGTFHALAKQQLHSAGKLGKIVTEGVRHNMIRAAWQDAGKEITLEEAIVAIEHRKSTIAPPADEGPEARIYYRYTDMLRRSGAQDFADLLINAVLGMRDGSVRRLPGAHILVDEFQDADTVQYAWLAEHAKGMTVAIVADDDQSIYGWRHAQGYKGVRSFVAEFDAQMVVLDTNYRSHQEILDPAARLISHNPERVEKRLVADKGSGGAVVVKHYQLAEEETQAVCSAVRSEPEQWAVLARTNRLLDAIEGALAAMQLPYYRSGGGSLWRRKHVLVLLEFINALARDENLGIQQALLWAKLTGDETNIVYDACKGRLVEGLLGKHRYMGLSASSREVVMTLRKRLKAWRTQLAGARPELTVHGMAEWLSGYATTQRQSDDIVTAACALCQMRGSLPQRTARVRRVADTRERHGVALLTLHSAKGLEFPKVWLLGMTEGLLPHKQAAAREVYEERRLCYVGMTRAMDQLVLSYAGADVLPSQFLADAGLIDRGLCVV